jgi:hypothetical protein
MRIACTHPGKLGDCIYSIPTCVEIERKYDCKIDFYTSWYCAELEDLFMYQSCINSFTVVNDYVIQRWDMGIQPWEMKVPDGYDMVFHLGFRGVPNIYIPYYIGKQVGVFPSQMRLESPPYDHLEDFNWGRINEYVVIFAKPTNMKSILDAYKEFAFKSPIKTVFVGTKDDYPGYGVDMTGLGFLNTLAVITHSAGFIGHSAPYVLADGVPYIKKILPHSIGYDMSHVAHDPMHAYLNYATADQLLKELYLA